MNNEAMLEMRSIAECIVIIGDRSGMTATAMGTLRNESRWIQVITQPGNNAYSMRLADALPNHILPLCVTGDTKVADSHTIIVKV